MLQKNGKDVKTHGFICAIEIEEGRNIMDIVNRLGESVMWMEGIGEIDVEHLGEITVIAGEENMDLEDGHSPSDEDAFLVGDVEVTKGEMH